MSKHGLYWGDSVVDIQEGSQPIIEGLLFEHDTVLLIGKEKSCKSIFTLQLCCALTSGESLFDTFSVNGKRQVLYLQAEGKRFETQQRLLNMMKGVPCDLNYFNHLYQPDITLDTKDGLDGLINIIDKNNRKPEVIVIDPLYMTMAGDMKDAKASRTWINNMKKLANRYQAAIIVVHHTHRRKYDNKGKQIEEGDDAIYGSFAWKAFADHVLLWKKYFKGFMLSCDTQRSSQIVDKIKLNLIHPKPLYFTIEEISSNVTMKKILAMIDENGKVTVQEIKENLEVSDSVIYRSLKTLNENGAIVKNTIDYPHTYSLKV